MNLSDMKTNDEVLAEDLKDREFRAYWERDQLAAALRAFVDAAEVCQVERDAAAAVLASLDRDGEEVCPVDPDDDNGVPFRAVKNGDTPLEGTSRRWTVRVCSHDSVVTWSTPGHRWMHLWEPGGGLCRDQVTEPEWVEVMPSLAPGEMAA